MFWRYAAGGAICLKSKRDMRSQARVRYDTDPKRIRIAYCLICPCASYDLIFDFRLCIFLQIHLAMITCSKIKTEAAATHIPVTVKLVPQHFTVVSFLLRKLSVSAFNCSAFIVIFSFRFFLFSSVGRILYFFALRIYKIKSKNLKIRFTK